MEAERDAVVLVHGIWMTGIDLELLRHRLARRGYDARVFRYPSLRLPPATNARRLATFTRRVPGRTLHYVAHSLGGLVVLHRFRRDPPRRPGRVVFLGTPVGGSASARALAERRGSMLLLGRSLEEGLLGDAPSWSGGRDLGTIAGVHPLGVGRFLRGLPGPNDGTVAALETRLEGEVDHLELPVSHTGLLVSPRVARAVATFLGCGRFGVHAGDGQEGR